ncbi:MAG: pyrroline-5-carboxylate reductase [Bacteroidaceae bacterium]|nr:pyrroline-5-carboxylate reductase [Bacteroidaceae bacterium]
MKITIIGAGNMGGALARGLARGTKVAAENIWLSDPFYDNLAAVKNEFPTINITTDNCEAVAAADVIILAVKPFMVQRVVEEIKNCIDYSSQTVASIVGGLGSELLDAWLKKEDTPLPPVYLIIPNTAIATLSSMTFISSLRSTKAMDTAMLDIFNELGEAMLVEERLMPAGTALASCGIAYAMRYLRAAMVGGIELGFRADEAKRIVMQTMRGAVDVLSASNAHPEAEIDKVTTPGGLTIKGLNAMEAEGFTNSVIEGLRASIKK